MLWFLEGSGVVSFALNKNEAVVPERLIENPKRKVQVLKGLPENWCQF